MEPIQVYIETGKRKTFAGAVDWPGWCRWGRDEISALASLQKHGTRYTAVLDSAGIDCHYPEEITSFMVIERHPGNLTTDFGAPDIPLDEDQEPVNPQELALWQKILAASWQHFDHIVETAPSKILQTGPREGGRDLTKIVRHVLEGDRAYLRRLAWKPSPEGGKSHPEQIIELRGEIIEALQSAVTQELPAEGPRGGLIWTPRFFVRRVTWHVLDHAWEIEDWIR